MPFISKPMPIEFWLRLQVRLESEFQALRSRIPTLLQPVPAAAETVALAQEQADQARAEVFARLSTLENLQMLSLVLRGQLRRAMFEVEIPDIESHIACLREVAGLYADFMAGLPRRSPVAHELNAAAAQLAGLRTAGQAEAVQAERQRLRTMQRELPILGAEDSADYESALRTMRSEIDQRESELQSIKSTTSVQLTVPDGLAQLLDSYGLEMVELAQDVAPAIEPPAADSTSEQS